jgi:enolase-phosphatase E1
VSSIAPTEPPGITIILLDIEGTTTPVDFVYRTLFTYARNNLSSFLHKSSSTPEVWTCIDALKARHTIDRQERNAPPEWLDGTAELEIDSAVRYGLWLMDRDSKIGPLKSLQGLIWREGYSSGTLHGEVYPDVPPAFDRWHSQGKEISIYSSGSTLAQQMLFRTTRFGDLTTSIKSFFDTRVGTKRSPESYEKIARISGYPPNQFLFLSDIVEELDAARAAEMHTALVVRSPNTDVPLTEHPKIKSFDGLA